MPPRLSYAPLSSSAEPSGRSPQVRTSSAIRASEPSIRLQYSGVCTSYCGGVAGSSATTCGAEPGTTWDAVLDGVRAVYVVPLDGAALTGPFVERAVRRGVERVVLLSGRGVDVPGYGRPDSPVGVTHIDGERAVRDSGVEWTILRPAWFAQNFSEGFFRDAVRAGELRLPAGDGAASFVDAEDIADVAAAALTGDGHGRQVYELSGPRALTMAEAMAEIGAATGREVRYVPLEPDAFVAELAAAGWPPTDASDFADTVAAIRNGLDAHVSDGVQRAVGRAPRDFTDFATAAAAAGAWAD